MSRVQRWWQAGLAASLSGLVLSASAQEPTGFYDRQAEGWFWYQRDSTDPSIAPTEPPAPQTLATTAPSTRPPVAPADPVEPPPLSAAWLRTNLEHYQLEAIDDPSPTKVALYLYLQKLALDKASRFTESFQRVVQSDPYLDETTRRPVGNYANLLNRVAGEQREVLLQSLAAEAGIWFFYRSDCPYCVAQAPVLRLLAQRQGFTVQAIALDGRALPDGNFADFRPDTGQAARLGVISTPALFLVRPPDGIAPLAQGLLSVSDLEQRILLAAREAGWIDHDIYTRTKPLVTDLTLDTPSSPLTEIPEDPETFLALMRARAAELAPVPPSNVSAPGDPLTPD